MTFGSHEFKVLVSTELEFAIRKFPTMNSLHEGYAVLLEEVEELWEEIKRKQIPDFNELDRDMDRSARRNQAAIIGELVQIAAMCERLYCDVASDGNKVHK